MATSEYTTIKYADLSPKQQEKVLRIYQEKYLESYEYANFILENNREELEELGFFNVKIYYSGFYSQGDGACFTGDINIATYLNSIAKGDGFTELKEIDPDYLGEFNIYQFGQYYHHKSVYVQVDDYMDRQDLTNQQYVELEKLRLDCTSYVRERSQLIYKQLEKSYEYYSSEEGLLEFIESHGVEFFVHKNGTIIFDF